MGNTGKLSFSDISTKAATKPYSNKNHPVEKANSGDAIRIRGTTDVFAFGNGFFYVTILLRWIWP